MSAPSRACTAQIVGVLLIAAFCAPGAARAQKEPKFAAAAVKILYVESNEMRLPPEFQVALYENLVEQVEKTKRFEEVFRDGDRRADDVRNLVVLRSTVRVFKEGSALARQVTTIAGATTITVRVQLTTSDGRLILDRDVEGNVRFFGENLRATNDFAKDVAKLIRRTF